MPCDANDNYSHPHLTHVINLEFGGLKSTTYRCDRCGDLLTVTIEPLAPVKIVKGVRDAD